MRQVLIDAAAGRKSPAAILKIVYYCQCRCWHSPARVALESPPRTVGVPPCADRTWGSRRWSPRSCALCSAPARRPGLGGGHERAVSGGGRMRACAADREHFGWQRLPVVPAVATGGLATCETELAAVRSDTALCGRTTRAKPKMSAGAAQSTSCQDHTPIAVFRLFAGPWHRPARGYPARGPDTDAGWPRRSISCPARPRPPRRQWGLWA